MKVNTNLPCLVSFGDYHDIDEFQETLKKIIPGAKVKEIGLRWGEYVAVIYVGKLTDPATKALIEQVKRDIREEEEEEKEEN